MTAVTVQATTSQKRSRPLLLRRRHTRRNVRTNGGVRKTTTHRSPIRKSRICETRKIQPVQLSIAENLADPPASANNDKTDLAPQASGVAQEQNIDAILLSKTAAEIDKLLGTDSFQALLIPADDAQIPKEYSVRINQDPIAAAEAILGHGATNFVEVAGSEASAPSDGYRGLWVSPARTLALPRRPFNRRASRLAKMDLRGDTLIMDFTLRSQHTSTFNDTSAMQYIALQLKADRIWRPNLGERAAQGIFHWAELASVCLPKGYLGPRL